MIRKQANEREQYLNEIEIININIDKNSKALSQAHDKAVEASTYKSQFLANMSHELRTPLNAIIGYSEMMAEDFEDSGLDKKQAIEDLNKIQGAGKHLLLVINEILDISKIEAGQINLHLEDFDVNETIQGIAATVEPLARKGNNRFTLNCPDNFGVIHSDVTRFRQILINLLGNASKFTKNGEISLTISRTIEDKKELIVCTVCDNGIGISQKNIEKIFKPFQQADSSTTREHGGTGLGLTISKRFCGMLGGSIRAESELNKGTQFIVKLPIDSSDCLNIEQQQLQSSDNSKTTITKTNPIRKKDKNIQQILFINNNITVRNLYQKFLEEQGFKVNTANTTSDCLSLAQQYDPDIITLDAMSPEKESWSLLQELKQDPQLKQIPVIMLSIVTEKYLHTILDSEDHLTKPSNWKQLGNNIRRWIDSEKKGP